MAAQVSRLNWLMGILSARMDILNTGHHIDLYLVYPLKGFFFFFGKHKISSLIVSKLFDITNK